MRNLIKRLLLTPNRFDSSASAYIDATGVTNDIYRAAFNTYFIGLKSNGIWEKIVDRHIMFNNAQTVAVNLKDPTKYPYTLVTITTPPTIDATGYTSSTSSYISSPLIPSVDLSTNDIHLCKFQLNDLGTTLPDLGCQNSTSQRFSLGNNATNTIFDCLNTSTGNGRINATALTRNKYVIGSRISASRSDIYSDGTTIGNSTGTSIGTLPSVNMIYCGFNSNGSISAVGELRKYALFGCGLGLTSAQALIDRNLTISLFQSLGIV